MTTHFNALVKSPPIGSMKNPPETTPSDFFVDLPASHGLQRRPIGKSFGKSTSLLSVHISSYSIPIHIPSSYEFSYPQHIPSISLIKPPSKNGAFQIKAPLPVRADDVPGLEVAINVMVSDGIMKV
jgi:hypothetical protein